MSNSIKLIAGFVVLLATILAMPQVQAQSNSEKLPGLMEKNGNYLFTSLKMAPADQTALLNLLNKENGNAYQVSVNTARNDQNYGRLAGVALKVREIAGNKITSQASATCHSLVYFFGGFAKTLGEHWWNGEAVWRAVSIPGFYQLDMNWLAAVPWFSVILGWLVLAVELGYPIFIWFRKTRPVFLFLVCCMHLGIGITMGLHYFAAIMTLLNVTAFGWPYLESKFASKHQHVLAWEPK